MGFLASAGSWLASNALGLLGLGNNVAQNVMSNKWNQKILDAQKEENEKNRQFNSSEAAIARQFQADFQREMFDKTNKYNSISNQVAQLKASGINPALAYSANSFQGASMPSVGDSPASSSGSITPTQYDKLDISNALTLERQRAEIDNIKASTEKQKEETEGQRYTNIMLKSDSEIRDMYNRNLLEDQNVSIAIKASQKDLTDAECVKVREEVGKIQKETDVLIATLDKINVEIAISDQEYLAKKIDNMFRSQYWIESLRQMSASANLSFAQAKSIIEKLPYEIAKLGAETAVANCLSAFYAHSTFKLDLESSILKATSAREVTYGEYIDGLNDFGKFIYNMNRFMGDLYSDSYQGKMIHDVGGAAVKGAMGVK